MKEPENLYDGFLKLSHRAEQRANSLADDMVKVLKAAQERLSGKISKLADEYLRKALDEETYQRRMGFKTAHRKEVEKILSETYAEIGQTLEAGGGDVIQSAGKLTNQILNENLGLAVQFKKLTKTQVTKWFESSTVDNLLINEWLAKLETAAADRIISAGRQALVERLDVAAAARLMREQGIAGSVPGLENLARTFLHSATHYAKEQVVSKQFDDVLSGWQHVATLDSRTCPVCGALDGKVYALNESKPALPVHWGCRCTYIPLAKSWSELQTGESEKPKAARDTRPAVVKETTRTVHHRDGSTSTKYETEQVKFTKQTYSQWLKSMLKKDPDFVRGVLGKTRFELYSAGKLSLKGMSAHGKLKKISEL